MLPYHLRRNVALTLHPEVTYPCLSLLILTESKPVRSGMAFYLTLEMYLVPARDWDTESAQSVMRV